METRNITLSIPRDILRKVKLLAVRRDTSVSGLLSETLKRLVDDEDAYVRARQRHMQLLDAGLDLGTDGLIAVERGELHERA